MGTPITTVKTSTQKRLNKTKRAAKPRAAIKARPQTGITSIAAGLADQVSIGARSIDPGMAQIDKLKGMSLARKKPGRPSNSNPARESRPTKKSRATPQNPHILDDGQAIHNSSSGGGGRIDVPVKRVYTADDTRWMQEQLGRHDGAEKKKRGQKAPANTGGRKPAKSPELEVPKARANSKLKKFLGTSNYGAAAFQLVQGGRKFVDGNYTDGGLEFVAGAAELFAEASAADQARNAKAVGTSATSATTQTALKTASKGQILRKLVGTGVAGAFAFLDAGHAFNSLRSGNEVAATEHAMNSAWGVASIFGTAAATGAVAYSLTRLGMSETGGDKLVTDYLESQFFSGDKAARQLRDATNHSDAFAVSGLRGQDRVNFMRRNPKRAARAIIGLQTALSEAKTPQEKARIRQRLHEVRRAKDRAFG